MPAISNVTDAEAFSVLLEDGLSEVFEESLPPHEKLYPAWLNVKKAREFYEDAVVVTGFGTMPEKPVGGKFQVDRPYISDTKRWGLSTFGLAFLAEHELIYWDRYGVFADMTRGLTHAACDRLNILAYSILNRGFQTTDPAYTVYNGEAIFDNAHQLLGPNAGTCKNRPDGNPPLSYLALNQAEVDFALMKNERGIFIRTSPDNIVVHPSKRPKLRTLLESEGRPGTSDNDKNVAPQWKPHYSPYLTSQEAWFVTGSPKSLKLHLRRGQDPHLRRDFDHSTWNSVFTMYMSAGIAILHYQNTYGSSGDNA